MPRASRASVKVPVPGPSSRTGPSDGSTPLVMRSASAGPEGAMAPTIIGLDASARKKSKVLDMELRLFGREIRQLQSMLVNGADCENIAHHERGAPPMG